MTHKLSHYRWAFLGTPEIAVHFLSHLEEKYAIKPDLIITNPDKPTGRKQVPTSPAVKLYADAHDIPCLQVSSLDEITDQLHDYDFFCVFAYGSLLRARHLALPSHGCVNIHPSLLPMYRGPSPIVSAILDDQKNTGVTLMKMTENMDAGPIIAQKPIHIDTWNTWDIHEKDMACKGADLFAEYIPLFLDGNITPIDQDDSAAIYCKKYNKEDMQIDLDAHPYSQYRQFCAFHKPFFVTSKRYILTQASYDDATDTFIMISVISAGKNERPFQPSDLL